MSCASMKFPLIDLNNLGENDSPRWESTKIQIREALQEYGCFEATFNNIIPFELRKSVGDGIRQLFDLPLAIKLLNSSHKPLHGYIAQNNFGPLMESMGIDGALSSHVVDTFANLMWPDQGNPTFRYTVIQDIQLYCEKLSELDKIVRRMVVESLGLEKYIDEHLNSTNYLCRFQKVVVSGDEARYTIGLFSIPKEGCVIKTPEELVNKDHPLLYKPFDYYKFIDFIYTDAAGRSSPDPLKEYCEA
ncbi:hypothetical protein SASPL_110193 [Salvia splendens]|uniref:Non-haem dioxygenase N-terminal domain-containing protein n=1 Tax=Salvia splendens TaxID=180675 RepID=A0A8X8Y5Q6_SALSN|nr:hypothetical protein SASPL_110193 [Salvia splendens]